MKSIKMLFFAGMACVLTVFSACTHEYSCQCTIKYTGSPGLPDSSVSSYPVRDTKKNAKKVCSEKSTEYEGNGIKTTETCTLL